MEKEKLRIAEELLSRREEEISSLRGAMAGLKEQVQDLTRQVCHARTHKRTHICAHI